MSDTNKEREAAYEHVREALVAVFEQRDGALSLVSKAIRVLPRLTEPSAQVQGETPAPLRGEEAVRSALRAYVQLDESRGNLKDKLYVQAVAALAAPMPQSAGGTAVVTDAMRKAFDDRNNTLEADERDDIIAAVLALAPGLSGWQEIVSDADRIAAWLLTQVQGGYSLMNRLYNERPNVADSVAAGAWIQTVTQHLHCLAANAAPQAPGIAPHQPQPEGCAVQFTKTPCEQCGKPTIYRICPECTNQPQPEPQEAAEHAELIRRIDEWQKAQGPTGAMAHHLLIAQCRSALSAPQEAGKILASPSKEAGKAETQDAWPDYIAGIIETYVQQNRTDEDREKRIAGIIRRRMYLYPKEASKAVPVADEAVAWIVECDGDSHLIRHSANFPGVFAGAEYKKTPLYLHPSQLEPTSKGEDAKDAARYRWLRHGDNDERLLMVYDQDGVRQFDHRFDNCWLPRNEKLDEAIDAAILAAAGEAK